MTKLTKKNVYTALINFANTGNLSFPNGDENYTVSADELRAFAEHEIELLTKRSGSRKGKNAAGDDLTAAITDVLTDEFQTISDIAAQIDGEDVTVAKVQYRLNALVKNGEAEKQEIKVGDSSRKLMGYRLVDKTE